MDDPVTHLTAGEYERERAVLPAEGGLSVGDCQLNIGNQLLGLRLVVIHIGDTFLCYAFSHQESRGKQGCQEKYVLFHKWASCNLFLQR